MEQIRTQLSIRNKILTANKFCLDPLTGVGTKSWVEPLRIDFNSTHKLIDFKTLINIFKGDALVYLLRNIKEVKIKLIILTFKPFS